MHAGDEQSSHEAVESRTPVFASNYHSRQAKCPRTRVSRLKAAHEGTAASVFLELEAGEK